MNIRIITLALLSTLILSNYTPASAMISANHQLDFIQNALEKSTKTYFREYRQILRESIWASISSITGAFFIYKGVNQLLNTCAKTEEKLLEQKESRMRSYGVGACKIIAGLIALRLGA